MKDIRIFVASSKELERERNYLAFLVLAKEDEFAARGLRVRLAKWEYVDPKMTETRTEDRYLDEMYDCDAAFIFFRDIAGMYTREELDKALARERAGASRLKTHQILFAADGEPDSDAAKLRASLPEASYGVWSGMEELREEFLSLVDRAAQCESLFDAPSETYVRKITAFLAADDELAEERNAFADTVLNVNDLLERAHRNIRVQLKFYNPVNAESVIESSEMGLVLYGTNYRIFGRDEVKCIYERVKDGNQNPKRFYVFFRDLDQDTEKSLDEAFRTFRDDFVSKLGHFTCQFGDANALRLSFLLSLERYASESVELYSTVSAPTAPVFVGREEELRKLCGMLEPVPGKFPAGRLPVITGAGGTGKSELVRQYASQLRVQYPGGVFQVDMEHRKTWDEAFCGILEGTSNNGVSVKEFLGLDEDKESDGERTEGGITSARIRGAILRKAREIGPVLLVLDNVEGFEDMLGEDGAFAKAFPSGFSERVRVNVVATARTCDVPLRENDWAKVFPLDDLSLDAALELLFASKKAENEEEVKAAKRVAELLGCRALFIRRVPAILKGTNKKARIVCSTYTKLAEALEKDALGTIVKTGTVDQSYWPTRLWEIVQDNLAEWGLGEACIRLVKIASFFSPDGFPKHILRHLWDELVYPGLEDWGGQDEVFDQAIDLAKNYNLFQSVDPVRIHRLDRAAILQTAKSEEGLEETVGKSLAGYVGMSTVDWLLLADNTTILSFIPEYVLLSRKGETTPSLQVELLSKDQHNQRFCQFDKFLWMDWAFLLETQPQFADQCPWERFDGLFWSSLLERQPRFSDRCPWEKLDEWQWGLLLRAQPQFVDRFLAKKLDNNDWATLFEVEPQFVDRFSWGKLDGGDWVLLLRVQPQFSNYCQWDKLNGGDWAMLLGMHPQFATHCQWDKLSGGDWVSLLEIQPQFADHCSWEKLGCKDWSDLIKKQPQFSSVCPWQKLGQLKGLDWVYLLREQPQFADHCPWGKLKVSSWVSLLGKQPQFADQCPWERLEGRHWERLLANQPHFAGRCPWKKLGGEDWSHLLAVQPQFADQCPWEKLDGTDWERLIEHQPQFAGFCPWDKLDSENWEDLLERQPQFAECCPWEILDGYALAHLLECNLSFADHCQWAKINGEKWGILLSEGPQFADRCPWEKLDGGDWARLLLKQPQFSAYCQWDKLNENDWILLLNGRPQFKKHCKRDIVALIKAKGLAIDELVECVPADVEVMTFKYVDLNETIADLVISSEDFAILFAIYPRMIEYVATNQSNDEVNTMLENKALPITRLNTLVKQREILQGIQSDVEIHIAIIASLKTIESMHDIWGDELKEKDIELVEYGAFENYLRKCFL